MLLEICFVSYFIFVKFICIGYKKEREKLLVTRIKPKIEVHFKDAATQVEHFDNTWPIRRRLRSLLMSDSERERDRYLRQAERDLDAAQNDLNNGYYEWACYKCHQAVEKVLKARNNTRDLSHDLKELLEKCEPRIPSDVAQSAVLDLQSLLGNHARMRYPFQGHAPMDVHDKVKAEKAIQLTQTVLSHL